MKGTYLYWVCSFFLTRIQLQSQNQAVMSYSALEKSPKWKPISICRLKTFRTKLSIYLKTKEILESHFFVDALKPHGRFSWIRSRNNHLQILCLKRIAIFKIRVFIFYSCNKNWHISYDIDCQHSSNAAVYRVTNKVNLPIKADFPLGQEELSIINVYSSVPPPPYQVILARTLPTIKLQL